MIHPRPPRIAAAGALLGTLLIWPCTQSIADSQRQLTQGRAVFESRCLICHGARADGNSSLGKLMNPHPANLTVSSLSARERERIVRKGGAAVGRSSGMPAWEQELSAQEISAVVAYVGTLRQANGVHR